MNTRPCRSWTSRRRYAARPIGRPAPPLPTLVGLHVDVDVASATLYSRVAEPASRAHSAVPDVLAPDLACVFCGINPGRVSAAAAAHFANPRNDFWRLLHDGGFTPRLFDPSEQFELLALGYGRHERRVPHDARLGRPAPRRLRRARGSSASRAS